jgi:nucleotide-binding universal stress UspA family protein
MIKLSRILYPTDFSELSTYALRYALSFSEAYKAKLHCLHVVDEAYQYWAAMGPDGVPLGPATEDVMESAEKEMEDFAAENLTGINVEVVKKVIIGRPFMEIIRYARAQDMDLIVLATHGRTGLSHVLLGSVAERVVRKAPCPVLSIRHPEHEFVMP